MKNTNTTKRVICTILALAMIAGALALATSVKPIFSDVTDAHWAKKYVERAFNEKVVEGTSYNEQTGERRSSPTALQRCKRTINTA